MSKYETKLITTATLDDEDTAALVGKFKSLIEANGTIDSIVDGQAPSGLPHQRRERGRLHGDQFHQRARHALWSYGVCTSFLHT